jgi:hypothetical protein
MPDKITRAINEIVVTIINCSLLVILRNEINNFILGLVKIFSGALNIAKKGMTAPTLIASINDENIDRNCVKII